MSSPAPSAAKAARKRILAIRAGMLCQEGGFRAFVAERLNLPGQVSEGAAAQHLRLHCQVASRRDLDTNPSAAERFAQLKRTYEFWLRR